MTTDSGQLAAMIADLKGYIERRAAELAAPAIEAARAEADEKVRVAEDDAQRWKDCNAELERQIRARFLPRNVVPRLSDRKQPAKIASTLVAVDLWHEAGHDCKRCPQPGPDEYVIHDYLEHQRSAARIAEGARAESRQNAEIAAAAISRADALARELAEQDAAKETPGD